MLETAISIGSLAVSGGIAAAVWYKIGKMEGKINFIYDNVHIAVDWKNGNK